MSRYADLWSLQAERRGGRPHCVASAWGSRIRDSRAPLLGLSLSIAASLRRAQYRQEAQLGLGTRTSGVYRADRTVIFTRLARTDTVMDVLQACKPATASRRSPRPSVEVGNFQLMGTIGRYIAGYGSRHGSLYVAAARKTAALRSPALHFMRHPTRYASVDASDVFRDPKVAAG